MSGLARFLSVLQEPAPGPSNPTEASSSGTATVTAPTTAARPVARPAAPAKAKTSSVAFTPTDRAPASPSSSSSSSSSSPSSSSSEDSSSEDEAPPTQLSHDSTFAGVSKGGKRMLATTLKNAESGPPPKRRKTAGLLGAGNERYDATGLVPRYTQASQVPPHLQKYFAQRTRLFSRYASGCLLDAVGWYSVTPERIAAQTAERCRSGTVLDAFCGVGGNAIAFARTCERVLALDTDPGRLRLARHNAAVYGVAERIEFVLGDFVGFARAMRERGERGRVVDVVFLSPPWGGPSYLEGSKTDAKGKGKARAEEEEEHPVFSLSQVEPLHGKELFDLARAITPNVAYYLPRNTDLQEVGALLQDHPNEKVEVEEEWMGSKLKALTCYFGGLAQGQEEMFDAP